MKIPLSLLLLCGAVQAQTYIPTTSYLQTNGLLPPGAIVLIISGTCPTGFTEVSALNGKFILGTVAANSNVGTSGGSASVTPTATSTTPTFTGTANQTTSSVSAGTPAGTNSTVAFTPAGTNATAAFTPAGTNGTVTSGATSGGTPAGTVNATGTTAIVVTTGSGNNVAAQAHTHTFTGNALATHTHSVPAETFTGSAGTVPAEVFTGTAATIGAETFTGSALSAHSHTLTPSGTVSTPTITVSAVNLAPPNILVIFCSKN